MKMFKGGLEWKATYTLEVYENEFQVFNENAQLIYHEDFQGKWLKQKFFNNKLVYKETQQGVIRDNTLDTIKYRLVIMLEDFFHEGIYKHLLEDIIHESVNNLLESTIDNAADEAFNEHDRDTIYNNMNELIKHIKKIYDL